ncbi:MAG: short-chain dehydrogenase [Burkholderiales bacterium]|jgi:short-subunit dehydrogenase|nr:short-chain dehydrogenase [Burkholderiales bacterium]
MQTKLKPLNQQVIVITGASSGIGLATAYTAAKSKAKLALIARNKKVLQQVVKEITTLGGEAIAIAADVGNRTQLEDAAKEVIKHYGRIDTWVNVAGVSIWGKLEEVRELDQRRLFETNFWGTYHGSLIAVRYIKKNGGAIINMGSLTSDVSLPLQGGYSASKHAVKGFTDSLRLELIKDKVPISVTLIKPGSIATPLINHVKNYTKFEPQLASPVYNAKEVVNTILKAAICPIREVIVGESVAAITWLNRLAPNIADQIFAKFLTKAQLKNKLAIKRPDNLYQTTSKGRTVTKNLGKPIYPCPYNRFIALPTRIKLGLIGGAGVLTFYAIKNLKKYKQTLKSDGIKF